MRGTLVNDGTNPGMDPRVESRVESRMEFDRSAEPHESQDLTLGMTALLGIFLAVVLVCAVFFGFGYSTGRTPHRAKGGESAAPASSAAPNAMADGSPGHGAVLQAAPTTQAAAPVIAKPSPGTTLSQADPDETEMAPEGSSRATSARAAYAVPRALPSSVASAGASAGAAAGAGVMVQIAAVMRPADADALARALRGNGYNATVRTEPQDKFLHVQVGPFATREEARAMRARLAAAGYNPFLKP